MKFVGRISKEGMVKIPKQFLETLEGLDLLITLKPIVVSDDEPPCDYLKKEEAALSAAGNCERCGIHPKSQGHFLCMSCITFISYRKEVARRESPDQEELFY